MSSIGRQIASELKQDVKACGHPTWFGFMPKSSRSYGSLQYVDK
jgi:hypothetical protein